MEFERSDSMPFDREGSLQHHRNTVNTRNVQKNSNNRNTVNRKLDVRPSNSLRFTELSISKTDSLSNTNTLSVDLEQQEDHGFMFIDLYGQN